MPWSEAIFGIKPFAVNNMLNDLNFSCKTETGNTFAVNFQSDANQKSRKEIRKKIITNGLDNQRAVLEQATKADDNEIKGQSSIATVIIIVIN